jgi:positive regulator of sigma E activity
MSSLVIWMFALTISLCTTILSAAAGVPSLHLGVTAIVSLAIAIVAVQAYRELAAERTSRSALAANTARYTGLVWIWAGIAIFVTYNYILSNWREWWQFSAGTLFVGCLCLTLAVMFQRDADEGHDDESILKVARLLNVIQIVGMLLAVIGLVADHKFDFGMSAARPDWAANNIFFFGALAIACIGAHSIASDKKIADGLTTQA